MNNVFIRLVKLPVTVHGFTMEDPAGDFNIYLNKDDAPMIQQAAFAHELKHIILDHFSGDKSAEKCEDEIKTQNVDIPTITRGEKRPFKALFL